MTRVLNAPYNNTFGATETGLPPATGALLPIGVVRRNDLYSERRSLKTVTDGANSRNTGGPDAEAPR